MNVYFSVVSLMIQLFSKRIGAPEWCQEMEPVSWNLAEPVYTGGKVAAQKG